MLDPQQAQEHLNEHLAWEERRLLRHCCWALAVQVAGGAITLTTGQLSWLLGATAVGTGLLIIEQRRWRRAQRRLPDWLVEGVARWIDEQPVHDPALAALRAVDGGLEWHHLVNQATARRKSNPA